MSTKEKPRTGKVEILIAEDSPTQAEQLKYLLEKHGYTVLAVSNGKDALTLLQQHKPMIIISDIVMPKMDGYELCRQVKASAELNRIPVILLTALSSPEDVIKGLECGADNFVTKPYDEKYLIVRIQYLLSNKDIQDIDQSQMGLTIQFEKQKFLINSSRLQIFNLLLSTYETAIQKNSELKSAQEELRKLNEQLDQKVQERTASLLVSEERYRLLVENANEGIIVTQDGIIKFANAKTTDISGYPIKELISKPFLDIVHDEHKQATKDIVDTISSEQFNEVYTLMIVTKAGETRWLDCHWAPTKWGTTPATLIFVSDVTERKQSEETIERLFHVLRSLRNVNQLITKENNRDKLLKGACDNLTKTRGYHSVWIALFDNAGKLLFTAESGVGKAFLPLLERLQHGELIECARHVLRKPDLFIKDRSSDCADCPLATTRIEMVEMASRLEYGTKTYGMLVVSLPTDLIPDMEEQSLFQELVNDIAFGLHKIEMDERRRRAEEKLEKTVMGAIDTIAAMAEARDPYTAGHQLKVSMLASAIAGEMGLLPEQIEKITMAGILHDIGKVSVPSEILSKPGRLNQIEFDLIKDHPRVGANILKSMQLPWDICPMVVQHHERMDGSGYPKGLSGQDIVLEARILAVADVVEAMTSHRPYRPALGIDKALEEISKNKGNLYDPVAVDACLKLFNEKDFKFEQHDLK